MADLVYVGTRFVFFSPEGSAEAAYAVRGQQVALPARRSAPGGGAGPAEGRGQRGAGPAAAGHACECRGAGGPGGTAWFCSGQTRNAPSSAALSGAGAGTCSAWGSHRGAGVGGTRGGDAWGGAGRVFPASSRGCWAGLRVLLRPCSPVLPEAGATGIGREEQINQRLVKDAG